MSAQVATQPFPMPAEKTKSVSEKMCRDGKGEVTPKVR